VGFSPRASVYRQPVGTRVKPFAAEIRSGVDITKINRLLADWEDEEILRKLELGK
jgi:hypothetical protein